MQVTIKGTTMTIGERVKTLRESRGWSRLQVAERAGEKRHSLSEWTVEKVEIGAWPNVGDGPLRAIASAFGMSFARLLGFDTQAALDEHRAAMKVGTEPEAPESQSDAPGPAQLTLGDARVGDLERDVADLTKRLDKANAWRDRVLDLLGVDRGVVNATDHALLQLEGLKHLVENLSDLRGEIAKVVLGTDDPTLSREQLIEAARKQRSLLHEKTKEAKSVGDSLVMYRNAWRRSIGSSMVAKSHEIDALVVSTERLKSASDRFWFLRGELVRALELPAEVKDADIFGKVMETIVKLGNATQEVEHLKANNRYQAGYAAGEKEGEARGVRKADEEIASLRAELDRLQSPRARALSACEERHLSTERRLAVLEDDRDRLVRIVNSFDNRLKSTRITGTRSGFGEVSKLIGSLISCPPGSLGAEKKRLADEVDAAIKRMGAEHGMCECGGPIVLPPQGECKDPVKHIEALFALLEGEPRKPQTQGATRTGFANLPSDQ